MALKDTLKKFAEQKRQAEEFEDQKPRLRAERSAAISELMTVLEQALTEFVRSGQLCVRRSPAVVANDILGPHECETLTITVAANPSISIEARPADQTYIGRRDVVEIVRINGTPTQRGQLFRLTDPSSNEIYWAIQAPGVQAPTIPSSPRIRSAIGSPQQNQIQAAVPLTTENFQAALDHLIG